MRGVSPAALLTLMSASTASAEKSVVAVSETKSAPTVSFCILNSASCLLQMSCLATVPALTV